MSYPPCVEVASYKQELSGASMHYHNTYQIVYIKEGGALLHISDKRYEITSPSVVFISNLESHSITPTGDVYRRYTVSLNPKLTQQCIKNTRLVSVFSNRPSSFSHVFDAGGLTSELNSLFDLLCKEMRHTLNQDSPANLYVESILTVLYRNNKNAFPPLNSSIDESVTSLKNMLERDYASSFTLDELSKRLNISTYYLAHSFKSVTGYGIKQYQILCRIAAAKELLAESDLPVSEICYKTGFSDLSNFSRYFSRNVGLSPTDYRKNYSNSGDIYE